MAQNDNSFVAAHNSKAGLGAAAQVVAALSEPEDASDQAAVEMPVSGVTSAALEVAAQGTGPIEFDAQAARSFGAWPRECISKPVASHGAVNWRSAG
ncbi:hypothetical protein AUC68_07280 [Methyloceanibacter methanicus]|uniref:Uncharacterized protein n=1 Tax=Methyloceanibacter methanicus TaxID=1774968 RepID=A0A1E3VZH6_9HYPH|nr:hypothetical protein AUC68_07280 [Methyloceanibacter methanicus]